MVRRRRLPLVIAGLCGLIVALAAVERTFADDAYHSTQVSQLKLLEGKLPTDDNTEAGYRGRWISYRNFRPYVVLDGDGEAYVSSAENALWMTPAQRTTQAQLVVRVPKAGKVTGRLYWPKNDFSGMEKIRFAIERDPTPDAKSQFNQAKQAYYSDLMAQGAAGTAWFRHQLRESRLAAGQGVGQPERGPVNNRRIDSVDDTFDLFSGGRAISENLQLDRALQPVVKGEEKVPLESIEGITVAEIDWKAQIKDLKPDPDPLAKLIPADQHVVLFPSFQAFVDVGDRLGEQGTVVMQLADPRSVDQRLVERYEKQLGLSLKGLGRIVGGQVVDSVALTGSDPYFVSGTDIALLLETSKPDMVKTLLTAQIALKAQQVEGAKPGNGKIGQVAFSGMRSADRQISSYVAVLPGAVLLTNSPYQIERAAAVQSGQTPPLAAVDEFTFFRGRYPRADKDESGLVFLSDATIRRWCGPRWRIAASRQTRDTAVLAELQATYFDKLVRKEIESGPLHTDLPIATSGELRLTPSGVQSAALGDLTFMTPIAELKFDEVTKSEADAYNRWRSGYQNNWRWAFDPIALRLSVRPDRLAADLTIMPLIAGSDYSELINISRGASVAPDACDRHDALFHAVLSLDPKSRQVVSFGQIAAGPLRTDPLGWVGQSVALYVDDDPIWKELAKAETDADREKFLRQNAQRLPVALWVEVSNGFKLTAFLAALRGMIEQTVPGMSTWEALEYNGQPYVRITPTERALSTLPEGEDFKPQLLYAATGKFFLLTPSEAVLNRALDRQAAREAEAKAAKNGAAKADDTAKPDKPGEERPASPWLGKNLNLQVDHRMLHLLSAGFGDHYQELMQVASWNNLPILNEWHRRYPDRDPVELHEQYWKERLVCPGGGKYVWNDDWQTMESTVYGHPGNPKQGPDAPPELLKFRFANFGVTFEQQGLRAQLTLEREAEKK